MVELTNERKGQHGGDQMSAFGVGQMYELENAVLHKEHIQFRKIRFVFGYRFIGFIKLNVFSNMSLHSNVFLLIFHLQSCYSPLTMTPTRKVNTNSWCRRFLPRQMFLTWIHW